MARLRDVAEAAGVSITTASMVLNPGKQPCRVGRDCAERIRREAAKLGYVPNFHARAMQIGRAEALGLAMDVGPTGDDDWSHPGMGGAYFQSLLDGVEAHTRFIGYNLAILGRGKENYAPDNGVRQILQKRMDALVVAAVVNYGPDCKLIADEPKLPVVLVEHEGGTNLPVVTYDEAGGIRLAVRHLAELGHRKLLWVGHEARTRREQYFVQSAWDLELRGASCRYSGSTNPVRERDPLADLAHQALANYLKTNRDFSAVVCYCDSDAIGAYGALIEAGLRIPQDVSVVGYDDFHAPHVYPRMTTVSHVLYEMGRRAAALAMEMATDPKKIESLRGYREAIMPKLIVRQSSGPAAKR